MLRRGAGASRWYSPPPVQEKIFRDLGVLRWPLAWGSGFFRRPWWRGEICFGLRVLLQLASFFPNSGRPWWRGELGWSRHAFGDDSGKPFRALCRYVGLAGGSGEEAPWPCAFNEVSIPSHAAGGFCGFYNEWGAPCPGDGGGLVSFSPALRRRSLASGLEVVQRFASFVLLLCGASLACSSACSCFFFVILL